MNGLESIQAVVLDLDGTLLNSGKRVSANNLRAVLDCYDCGIHVIIATARPARSVRLLLPAELLALGCLIYYNGAHTVDSAYGVEDHIRLDSATTAALCDTVWALWPNRLVAFEADGEMYSNAALSMEQRGILGLTDGAPLPAVLPLDAIRRLQPEKLLLTNETNLNIFPELARNFAGRVQLVLTDGERLIQIMSASVSKAAALGPVLRRRGLQPEHIMVFGDDYNDLELFELCGYPVAMENAIADLKSRAAFITKSNDDDGVASVLDKLVKLRKPAVI
ncbi:HAD family hydrolase [Paenibacillus piri]|uniref:HAD family hydrolase n=1 Tax=Paenibacillus piri TaxID=2547395 RepID=A0A4R5KR90_9BACL|nr:HAD family hydrolase [Paenibacillus piri]TDF97518.1 HAD family hydrolase [Paenibacillus piri]